MPELSHPVPLRVNGNFLADLLLSSGRIAAQGIPIIPRGPPPLTPTEISMNFPFLVITYIDFLEWVLVSHYSLPSLPLNTLFSSCHDSSLTLIKVSGCRTLASLSYFPLPPLLPHFWSPACEAVMIFLFNFWESLLSCLSLNYKINLRDIPSYV